MTCEEIEELAGAIALDALPEDERAAIEEHLATCRRGHPRIGELRAVAVLLLEAAPEVEPPAGLRRRILDAARTEGMGDGSDAPLPLRATQRPTDAGFIERQGQSWWARGGWVAAAAAVVAVIALAVWNITLQRDVDRTRDQLADARGRLSVQQRALLVLAGEGAMTPFTAAVAGAGGSVLQPSSGDAAIVVVRLQPVEDHVYQVWALKDGRPTSLGIFQTDESGSRIVALDHNLQDVDALAITLEPAPNGSVLPTSEPLLIAPLRG
jgi:anti-sigma-K factor RskA